MLISIIGAVLLYVFLVREVLLIDRKNDYKQGLLSWIIFTILFVMSVNGLDIIRDWLYIVIYILLVICGIVIFGKLTSNKNIIDKNQKNK